MNRIYLRYLLMVSIIGAVLTSCGEAMEWNDSTANGTTDVQRQLVMHEVTVSIDDAATRVAYEGKDYGGLKLSWEADELLSVYIKQADNTIVYAGQVASHGSTSDATRHFTGEIKAKAAGETYVYVHPALFELDQEVRPDNYQPLGKIDYTNQSGALGSTAHLTHYIPLVWTEGSLSSPTNNGYAMHLNLKFNEDPGKINKVTVQTMQGAGATDIFPASFDAKTMSATNATTEVTLNVTSGTATKGDDNIWTADAYLASSNVIADVFRTKFNVKVDATNGTFYNEYRSFPGQESANADEGLSMLVNGKCYYLTASMMSKEVAPTIINSTYKVNSLLGMWNEYGKVTDPFGLIKAESEAPLQLKTNILDRKDAFMSRIMENAFRPDNTPTPTFTWNLLVKQIGSNGVIQENVTYNNILITSETEVYVTFISEYAWAQNLLGYYHYPTSDSNPSSSNVIKTIIFPNVSKGGHVPFNRDGTDCGANINPNGETKNIGNIAYAPLQEFTTVQLLYRAADGSYSKKFPSGTTIGFMLMRDTQASSGSSAGTDGSNTDVDNSGYSPRGDNSLVDWSAWRLFTNTAWNSENNGFYGNCRNFFVSGKVVGTDGNVINGLAIYGAKDDKDHNYSYSFSSILFMVSTSDKDAMTVQVPGALNLGTGAQIITP